MNINEFKNKFLPYSFYITKAIICMPSNLLFMSLFAPSKYESKLWDLKKLLKTDSNDDEITRAFNNLINRYSTNTSTPFDNVLEPIIERNSNGGVRFKKIMNRKYLYKIKSAVNWELIRIQPIRYLWKEIEQITTYGLIFSIIIWSGIVCKPNNEKLIIPLYEWIKKSDSYMLYSNIKKNIPYKHVIINNGNYDKIFKFLPNRIKYPYLILNCMNFVYNLGEYKKP